VWQRFFVAQQGSPLGLLDVHGNKTGPNTTNIIDATVQPRAIVIDDLLLHGCAAFVMFLAHRHDFIFSTEWQRNFWPKLYGRTVQRKWSAIQAKLWRKVELLSPKAGWLCVGTGLVDALRIST